jgi:hypothetical protein
MSLSRFMNFIFALIPNSMQNFTKSVSPKQRRRFHGREAARIEAEQVPRGFRFGR